MNVGLGKYFPRPLFEDYKSWIYFICYQYTFYYIVHLFFIYFESISTPLMVLKYKIKINLKTYY